MPLNQDKFRLEELTASVLSMPPKRMKVSQKGIFNGRGIGQTTAVIEQREGILRLIGEGVEGGPPDILSQDAEGTLSLTIPINKAARSLVASDFQDLREFGSFNRPRSRATEEARALRQVRDRIDVTHEARRVSALKGIILKSDGSTLYNLYTQFGVTPKTVDFALDVDTTDIVSKCAEVINHMEDNLNGDTFSGVRCLCSPTFFEALRTHPLVKDLYTGYAAAAGLQLDPRIEFPFGGIVFEQYFGSVTESDGDSRALMTANQGICYPEGTSDTFDEVWAPADLYDTANTLGLEMYAYEYMQNNSPSSAKLIEGQSRVLPYVKRPAVLVTVTI